MLAGNSEFQMSLDLHALHFCRACVVTHQRVVAFFFMSVCLCKPRSTMSIPNNLNKGWTECVAPSSVIPPTASSIMSSASACVPSPSLRQTQNNTLGDRRTFANAQCIDRRRLACTACSPQSTSKQICAHRYRTHSQFVACVHTDCCCQAARRNVMPTDQAAVLCRALVDDNDDHIWLLRHPAKTENTCTAHVAGAVDTFEHVRSEQRNALQSAAVWLSVMLPCRWSVQGVADVSGPTKNSLCKCTLYSHNKMTLKT